MTFEKFYKEWITKHIKPSNIYGNLINKCVAELSETINNQGHSGTSWNMTVTMFTALLQEYQTTGE